MSLVSNLTEYAKQISPSLYEKLKQAVETGKWQDGKMLNDEQKVHSMQLVLTYQSLFNEQPDHLSVAKGGEVHLQSKADLRSKFRQENAFDVHFIDL